MDSVPGPSLLPQPHMVCPLPSNSEDVGSCVAFGTDLGLCASRGRAHVVSQVPHQSRRKCGCPLHLTPQDGLKTTLLPSRPPGSADSSCRACSILSCPSNEQMRNEKTIFKKRSSLEGRFGMNKPISEPMRRCLHHLVRFPRLFLQLFVLRPSHTPKMLLPQCQTETIAEATICLAFCVPLVFSFSFSWPRSSCHAVWMSIYFSQR